MDAEKLKAFNKFVEDEKLNADKLKKLTEDYIFTQRTPSKQEVVDILENQPSIMQRSSIGDLILSKFMNFIDTFFNE
jgi:type I restriction enzyme R subunit